MKRLPALLLAACMALTLAACAPKTDTPPVQPEQSALQTVARETMFSDFASAVSPEYAYDIAMKLTTEPAFFNSPLGGRTAGSQAEHAAAAYLEGVMLELGLQDVERVAAPCDLWQFNGATFTVDGKDYDVYSYATAATPPEGIETEVLYLGDGTMWDYEQVDVQGKIVLIDIDQRANWWITYPMLEAQFQGAAAILAANVGGFSQIADDALNCQDICGPTGIPCLSIGLADAKEIQGKLAQGPVTGKLTVDNVVEIGGGTTYNVMGRIPGKRADHQILVGAHYDVHFRGFQDDNCAVGLTLAMAKAMLDSGYQPENDIVFVLHGAEEWGASYTQYDWTVGAWEMINNIHPEWVGKTLAFLNFELPAYEFSTYTSTYSAPELYALLDGFVNRFPYAPKPEGCFPDGVRTKGYQTYTYSDDFSYYAAGVPSMVNGFLLQEDMESVFDFYVDIYHSQYDLPDTYNEAVMDFNLRYYGALAMYIDQQPALELDFTAQYARILSSIDRELMAQYGADGGALLTALEELNAAAWAARTRVEEINVSYENARNAGDVQQMEQLRDEGRAMTQKNLAAFQYAQEHLLGLMYERPIVPHQAPQENIALCREIVALLERGEVARVVDEYAWTVNNVLEWYAMYFSPQVIAIQDDMLWGASNAQNLYWGTDRGFAKAQVDAATRSLMTRYDEVGGDFSQEIAVYQAAIAAQQEVLVALVAQEVVSVEGLTALLA